MHPSSHSAIRRGIVAGAAVLVLAGSAVGIAVAQTQPTPTPSAQNAQSRQQAFLDALAKRLNTTTSALTTAISQARTDAGLPAGNEFPGRGHDKGGGPGFGRGAELDAAATAIGIPAAQLRTELPGKSLAQVAVAHGKSATDVATALKNAAHTRIDQELTAGRLTADQASARKTQVDQRIDQMVTQVMPQPGPGRGPHGGGGGLDLD